MQRVRRSRMSASDKAAMLNRALPQGLMSSLLTLGHSLSRLDVTVVANSVRHDALVRLVGGYLVFVAVGLAAVWCGMWGAYALAGRPTPIEPETSKIVAALDLSLMVPALAVGGVMLWRQTSWGYVIATMAAILALRSASRTSSFHPRATKT